MTRLKAFIACPDILIKEHGLTCAAVWGRIWRYTHGKEGKCTASQQTIADELAIARSTVYRYMKILLDDGYIEDLTPDRKHITHEYKVTDKLHFTVEVSVAEKDTSVAEKDTSVAEKDTSIQEVYKEDIKRGKPRDTRLDHPAIKAYRTNARRHVPIIMRDDVIEVIGEEVKDVDNWSATVKGWVGSGWNPGNVKGMLEKYQEDNKARKEELPNARDLYRD